MHSKERPVPSDDGKPVVEYAAVAWQGEDPVGQRVFVTASQPWGLEDRYTARVVIYDESTGIFETENTVYIPSNSQD